MKLIELKRAVDLLVITGHGDLPVRVYDEINKVLFQIENHSSHGYGPFTATPSETVDLSIEPAP